MATAKQRILISLSPETAKVIGKLAKAERIPRATKISQWVEKMLEDYIEDEEDRRISKIADVAYEEWERTGKKTYSHEEVWAAIEKKVKAKKK